MAGVQECFNCAGFASSMAGTAFSMAGYGRYGRRKKWTDQGSASSAAQCFAMLQCTTDCWDIGAATESEGRKDS